MVLLNDSIPGQYHVCREVEAICRAGSMTMEDYQDHIRRSAYNLVQNPAMGVRVVMETDEVLAEGTLVGRIHQERISRTKRFHDMIQQKYDCLNEQSFQSIIRCRRCGHEEVSMVEKQTRSADEAASVFCVCMACKNRWVIR